MLHSRSLTSSYPSPSLRPRLGLGRHNYLALALAPGRCRLLSILLPQSPTETGELCCVSLSLAPVSTIIPPAVRVRPGWSTVAVRSIRPKRSVGVPINSRVILSTSVSRPCQTAVSPLFFSQALALQVKCTGQRPVRLERVVLTKHSSAESFSRPLNLSTVSGS